MNNQNILIALHGETGSGKDTIADYLVSGYGFVKMAFADKLKEELAKAYRQSVDIFNERAVKEHPMHILDTNRLTHSQFLDFLIHEKKLLAGQPRTPREMMQAWGDFRRSKNPMYFIEAVMKRILDLNMDSLVDGTPVKVVITDLRRQDNENELTAVRHALSSAMQAKVTNIWHILRPDNPYKTNSVHVTNSVFPRVSVDVQINNDQDVGYLYTAVHSLMFSLDPSNDKLFSENNA
jgi:adenylate kinase family enzyme